MESLDREQITFVRAEEKKLARHHNIPGRFRESYLNVMPRDAEWVTAVILPGN